MKTSKFRSLMAGMCALLGLGLQPAQAVLVSAGTFNDPNDCAGYFNGYPDSGTGFNACQIFVTQNNETYLLSPVIAKFDTTNDVLPATATDKNTASYPSVAGDEWSFSNVATNSSTGTWTYTPGTNDPGIKYWVAKAGNDFVVFWEVDQSVITAGTCVNGTVNYTQTNFNLACLQAANVVTTGTWATEPGGGGNLRGLSHITFYDTVPVSTTSGGPPEDVPEPSVLALLGLGLLSGLVARRRFTRQL
jgi:hypothetical protein